MSWRFVNAAVRGTSHVRAGVPCQDDCIVDLIAAGEDEVLIAIASDGAGSAQCAEQGAGLVCESLLSAIESWIRGGGAIVALDRTTVEAWIAHVRDAIESRAQERALTPRDFACTLVGAIASSRAAAFFQIGDGAIVIGTGAAYQVVFWPDGGEYANMTFFTTDDDWAKHLHFTIQQTPFDDVALMTDGLQRLALHFATRSPHRPFFEPLFAALHAAAPGYASPLNAPLEAFLESDAVNTRTDDDKSLVIATRRMRAADGTV